MDKDTKVLLVACGFILVSMLPFLPALIMALRPGGLMGSLIKMQNSFNRLTGRKELSVAKIEALDLYGKVFGIVVLSVLIILVFGAFSVLANVLSKEH